MWILTVLLNQYHAQYFVLVSFLHQTLLSSGPCNGQWLTQPRCCAPSPVFLFLSFSLSISAPCVTGCRPAASLSYFQGKWGDSFLMRSFSIQAAQLNSGRKCGYSISRIGWKTSQLWLLYQCLVCDLQSLLYAHWLFVSYVMSQSMRGWGE